MSGTWGCGSVSLVAFRFEAYLLVGGRRGLFEVSFEPSQSHWCDVRDTWVESSGLGFTDFLHEASVTLILRSWRPVTPFYPRP